MFCDMFFSFLGKTFVFRVISGVVVCGVFGRCVKFLLRFGVQGVLVLCAVLEEVC